MERLKRKRLGGKITEIRDVLHGSIEIHPWELAVIDSPLFQRLRRILQLGFAEIAYPCATHNRYTHSLGVMYLAGRSFEYIFRDYEFSSEEVYERYYNLVRVAALLHDIGHGPLSHTTEFAMPKIQKMGLPSEVYAGEEDRRASHEDYTLKIILDSPVSDVLRKHYTALSSIEPHHIACLMSTRLAEKDDFFIDKGLNYRKILTQIISSELDADRMDYLQRDAYFCGVSYGNYDLNWLLSNLTYYVNKEDNKKHPDVHLALSSRGIYTFEDFLLSRYHMSLMVYYHYKSIIYEKTLKKYLSSSTCSYKIPADIESYTKHDDNHLYTHLSEQKDNEWATRVYTRTPYKLSFENYSAPGSSFEPDQDARLLDIKSKLVKHQTPFIESIDRSLLSKYANSKTKDSKNTEIYVAVKDRISEESFVPLEKFTELFSRYEKEMHISRIYTPEKISNLASL